MTARWTVKGDENDQVPFEFAVAGKEWPEIIKINGNDIFYI